MSFAEAATAVVADGSPFSAHAGSTLSAHDRRRLVGRALYPSRGFILSSALLSIAAVLAGIAALPSIESRFARPVFYYQVLPLPVASAAPLHAGQPVPLVVSRCVDDPSLEQSGGRGGYDFSRALVAADESTTAALVQAFPNDVEPGPPARLLLPASFADAGNGCEQTISTRNVLPAATPEGRYLLEGVARYLGATGRVGSAYWRSEVFAVIGGT